jgi:hypothetical protein
MQSHRLVVVFGCILTLSFEFSGVRGLAATPEFAVAASNVTMPESGNGTTQYTVTGIPASGTLSVSCQYAGTNTEARLPTCTYGPILAPRPVTAGETVTGSFSFFPYGSAIPLSIRRTGGAPLGGLALAGGLLVGLGLRRRGWRRLGLAVVIACSLAGLAGVTACRLGPFNGMTPGTYPYIISAGFIETGTNVIQTTSATISVTIP